MNLKCECYIHSLKQGEKNVLSEATILKRLGDNDYLAEVGGVKCHAIFNPAAGARRTISENTAVRGRAAAARPLLLLERR